MEKTYVIKDAEKVLVYQIEQGGTQERKDPYKIYERNVSTHHERF